MANSTHYGGMKHLRLLTQTSPPKSSWDAPPQIVLELYYVGITWLNLPHTTHTGRLCSLFLSPPTKTYGRYYPHIYVLAGAWFGLKESEPESHWEKITHFIVEEACDCKGLKTCGKLSRWHTVYCAVKRQLYKGHIGAFQPMDVQ